MQTEDESNKPSTIELIEVLESNHIQNNSNDATPTTATSLTQQAQLFDAVAPIASVKPIHASKKKIATSSAYTSEASTPRAIARYFHIYIRVAIAAILVSVAPVFLEAFTISIKPIMLDAGAYAFVCNTAPPPPIASNTTRMHMASNPGVCAEQVKRIDTMYRLAVSCVYIFTIPIGVIVQRVHNRLLNAFVGMLWGVGCLLFAFSSQSFELYFPSFILVPLAGNRKIQLYHIHIGFTLFLSFVRLSHYHPKAGSIIIGFIYGTFNGVAPGVGLLLHAMYFNFKWEFRLLFGVLSIFGLFYCVFGAFMQPLQIEQTYFHCETPKYLAYHDSILFAEATPAQNQARVKYDTWAARLVSFVPWKRLLTLEFMFIAVLLLFQLFHVQFFSHTIEQQMYANSEAFLTIVRFSITKSQEAVDRHMSVFGIVVFAVGAISAMGFGLMMEYIRHYSPSPYFFSFILLALINATWTGMIIY